MSEDVFQKYDYLFGKSGSDSGKANINSKADNNWGDPIDFTIEEIFDMPVMGK